MRDIKKLKESKRRWYENVVRGRRQDWLLSHGPCIDCGSWESLEVDHVNRETKVDHKVWSWRQERRDVELEKCVVRCNSCHLIKTISENRRPIKHGTEVAYRNKGCRCEECCRVHSARIKAWKQRVGYGERVKLIRIAATGF